MAVKNNFLGGIVGLKKTGNKAGSRLALRKQEAEEIIKNMDISKPSDEAAKEASLRNSFSAEVKLDAIGSTPDATLQPSDVSDSSFNAIGNDDSAIKQSHVSDASVEPAATKSQPSFATVGTLESDNTVQTVLSNFAPMLLNQKISLNDLVEAPEDWNFFPSPDNETMTLLCKSIYQQGQLSPALVWEQEDGKYMILGGHTRAAVLKVLFEVYQENRFMNMTCHVYGKEQITPDEAQQIIIMNNMTQRAKESTTLMMRSVVRMVELEKSSRRLVWGEKNPRINDIIAEKFHTSSSTIKRLYALRNLIPELVMLLENNTITNKLAIRFSMLPPELQHIIVNRQIYDRNFTEQQLRNLPSAKTESELLDILAARPLYYFTGARVQLDEPLPADFKKISLAVSARDLPLIKEILKDAAANSSYELTKETRDFLNKILN